MDKKRKGLLIGMILALAAGTSTAAAMVINDATAKEKSGSVDTSIYYQWGTSQSVDDIGDLKAGTYVYRKVVAGVPTASAGVNAQECKVTFTLSATEATKDVTYVLTGLKVEIIKDEAWPQSGTPSGTVHTLVSTGDLTWTDTYDLTGATEHYYSLRVSYDGTAPETGKVVSGDLNVALNTVDKA